ncbi:polysaccharide biosynthesis tyrosine autokinase [Erwiniaceae bacterium CAU 1747]
MSSVITNKQLSSESDGVDLGRMLGELLDHKKLIIFITSIFTFIAILYALFSAPIYQADALIQVEQKQGNSLINSLSQVLPNAQPPSAPEISVLQSRMILGKTVDDLNLETVIKQNYFPIFGQGWSRLTGEKEGKISVSRFYLSQKKSDDSKVKIIVLDNLNYLAEFHKETYKGRVGSLLQEKDFSISINGIDAEPNSEFTVTYKSKLDTITNLQKVFTVADQGKDSGMLVLTLLGYDPELTRKTLESISNNYLSQNIDRQAAQDAKSLEFLDHQLPKIRQDLDKAENKLNAYRQKKDSVDLSLEAKSVLEQVVNVDNQLNELTFREAEISQLFTKEHPTYKSLVEKRATLEEEKAKLNKKVTGMPETQQEVLRLSRDVESGRAVYMQLLNRQQELSIAKSSAIGNVRIIDNAVTQPIPVKPKKGLIIIVGFLIGAFISVGVVILKVLLRKGIESPEQLEELGINVYASIPLSEWLVENNKISKNKEFIKGRKKLDDQFSRNLAIENPADLAIEAIRGLRTSLHFAMMEASNNVLMISGASPNAGKTFVSSNLAIVIAQAGKKLLFIDADMRKGYTHRLFDASLGKGLSDILSGTIICEQAVQSLKTSDNIDFDFISRGNKPPNPAELLMHKRFEDLIKWASENYDYVIVDSPPILAVTDAAIIGRYIGTTLLVSRFESNTAREMLVSLTRFEQSGVAVKGCILNGVVKKASTAYGYGYNHYGYSYKESNED